jgi:hypothetical protein
MASAPSIYNWKDYTGFMANNHRLHVWGLNYTYDVPKLAARSAGQPGWPGRSSTAGASPT